MPFDNNLVLVEHRRVSEAEFLDNVRKLLDRSLVDSRVVLVRDNLVDRNFNNLYFCHRFCPF